MGPSPPLHALLRLLAHGQGTLLHRAGQALRLEVPIPDLRRETRPQDDRESLEGLDREKVVRARKNLGSTGSLPTLLELRPSA